MTKTSRLGMPYIIQGQAQKEVTHNQALNMLDVYVNPVVEAIVNTLPTTAAEGSIYILNHKLAQFSDGNWSYYSIPEYMEVWVKATQAKMVFNGYEWVDFICIS